MNGAEAGWADRYSRQTALPGFGAGGQERLAGSCVALTGDRAAVRAAGLYLTAAGIGRLLVPEPLAGEIDPLNDLASVGLAPSTALQDGAAEGNGVLVATSPGLPEPLWGTAGGGVVTVASGENRPPGDLPGDGRPSPFAGLAEVILGCRLAAAVLLALVCDRGTAGPALGPAHWDLAELRFKSEPEYPADTPGNSGQGRPGRPAPAGQSGSSPGRGRVLLIGAGGLGSGAALGLAAAHAAGVLSPGLRLTVVDPDVVEQSNLPRQVLHRAQDVGRPKADSAGDAVRRVSPRFDVRAERAAVTPETIGGLLAGADVVISAVDNFPSRYMINDACVSAEIPLAEAGVLRFEGLVMLARPPGGPCYRCLFPVQPAPGSTPDPAEVGVLGPLAGLAGAMQALLAVMVLRGEDERALGRLLVLDAGRDSVRAVKFGRDPRCPACGRTGGDQLG